MTKITPVVKPSFMDRLVFGTNWAPPKAVPFPGFLPGIAPPAPKSTVGRLMETMSRELSDFTGREAVLVAEIADREEELRQVRASKRAVAGAMASLHGDVALTDEEDRKAEAAADAVAMEALVNVN